MTSAKQRKNVVKHLTQVLINQCKQADTVASDLFDHVVLKNDALNHLAMPRKLLLFLWCLLSLIKV